jgi:ABC-type nickel/cobalt efflux system permease component RcnA
MMVLGWMPCPAAAFRRPVRAQRGGMTLLGTVAAMSLLTALAMTALSWSAALSRSTHAATLRLEHVAPDMRHQPGPGG